MHNSTNSHKPKFHGKHKPGKAAQSKRHTIVSDASQNAPLNQTDVVSVDSLTGTTTTVGGGTGDSLLQPSGGSSNTISVFDMTNRQDVFTIPGFKRGDVVNLPGTNEEVWRNYNIVYRDVTGSSSLDSVIVKSGLDAGRTVGIIPDIQIGVTSLG
jgi:hypothetical protein